MHDSRVDGLEVMSLSIPSSVNDLRTYRACERDRSINRHGDRGKEIKTTAGIAQWRKRMKWRRRRRKVNEVKA